MAVKRLKPDFLEKVKTPISRETLSGANLYKYLKYRIWYGNAPPLQYVMEGDIWRQPVPNTSGTPTDSDIWQMRIGGSWVSMLATTTEAGLLSASDKVAVNSIVNATNLNVANTIVRRGDRGGAEYGGLRIDDSLSSKTQAWAAAFGSALTKKNTINFDADPGSEDPGAIVHETCNGFNSHGVIHILPSDNDVVGTSHVAIGRLPTTGDPQYRSKIFLYTNGNIECVSVNTTSKREAKENIIISDLNAVDYLKEIEVVEFSFKDDQDSLPRIGFIADDTDSLVSGPNQDKMDHANLLGVLIKANQELAARVEELESQLGV